MCHYHTAGLVNWARLGKRSLAGVWPPALQPKAVPLSGFPSV